MRDGFRNGRSAGHLSDRIRIELEAKIFSGEWPLGHRIPSEMALTEVYGCSRMTVNKVILKLVDMGLLERNRRAGTVVRRPTYQSSVSQLIDIGRDVASRHNVYSYKRLTQHIDRSVGHISIDCLHFSNEMPIAYEARTINLATVPDADHVDFSVIAPGRWLIDNVPWSEGENKVSAVNADADLAVHLQLRPGQACLLVERDTWNRGRHLTSVRQYFHGEDYHLLSRFGPSI